VLRILGRAAVVVVVSILATMAAAVSPEAAQAQTATPYESLRSGSSTYLDDFYSKVLHDSERSHTWHTQVTGSNASKNVLYKQATKARIGARLLPAFGTFAVRASLVGAAGYVGWQIYQNWSGGGSDQVDMWIDSPALGENMLFNPCAAPPNVNCPPAMGWDGTLADADSGQNSQTGIAFAAGYKYEVGAAWIYTSSSDNSNGGCSTAYGGPSPPCWVLHLNPHGYRAFAEARNTGWGCDGSGHYVYDQSSSCVTDWDAADALGYPMPTQSQAGWDSRWPTQLWFAIDATKEQILAEVPGASEVTVGTYPYGAGTITRTKIILTTSEMQGITDEPLDSPTGTPTQTYNYNVPGPYTAPGDVGTSTDTQEALDEFDSPCGQSFINWVLAGTGTWDAGSCGGWQSVPTFALLKPLVNEPYPDYIARLQAEGWLGSATTVEVDETEALPQMGPEGVVSVRIGTNVYRPTSWPSISPRWNVNVNITVRYNPADLPEAPGGGEPLPPGGGGGTGTGTGVPVPPTGPLGDWCPACPDVDFGPLTEADFGGAFPFGVLVWVGDTLGTLTTTADAPAFDFDYTETAAGSMGTYNLGHYNVDLEVLDPYMSIIRTILSWCIWIGGIWWFGSRLLGFRETGDPGSAVDDAW
jgi:hypothetical protein